MRYVVSAVLLVFSGCAASGASRKYFLEDSYARYYKDRSGKVMRVESDGAVLDVACLPMAVIRDTPRRNLPAGLCSRGELRELGKVHKVGGDWDMSAYAIEPGGGCRPLLGVLLKDAQLDDWDGAQADQRRSCWHRVWEVPAAVVAVPAAAVILIGLVTSPIWVPLLLLL